MQAKNGLGWVLPPHRIQHMLCHMRRCRGEALKQCQCLIPVHGTGTGLKGHRKWVPVDRRRLSRRQAGGQLAPTRQPPLPTCIRCHCDAIGSHLTLVEPCQRGSTERATVILPS